MKRTVIGAAAVVVAMAAMATPAMAQNAPGVRGMGGWSLAYDSGPTFLVAATLPVWRAVELEAAFQTLPVTDFGRARAYTLGAQVGRDLGPNRGYLGLRGGYLDDPVADGAVIEAFGAFELGAGEAALRLEPGVWYGLDEAVGAGPQVLAGLVWRFD